MENDVRRRDVKSDNDDSPDPSSSLTLITALSQKLPNIESISHIPEKISHIPEKISQIPGKISQIPEKIAHFAWTVIPFDALPFWMKDNEFLVTNYRPPMYSIRGCMKSIFRLHTETLNIWTHLVGFLFFTILTFSVYIFRDYITQLFEENIVISELPWDEQIMLLFFFVGAMLCLLCSTAFHTFSNHSHNVYVLTSRLDYSGIAFLITGSSIPAYYYGFYCITWSRFIHITTLIILCTTCITISLWRKFGSPGYRLLRFAVFVTFGLYGVVPSVHLFILKGPVEPYFTYMIGLIIMALLYLTGAGIYVLRIPERFFPGKCDIWAHSHQLFHVCVLAAALVHYNTLLNMVKDRLHAGAGDCTMPLELLYLV